MFAALSRADELGGECATSSRTRWRPTRAIRPEHESKLLRLINETKQQTVPFVYLRGQFIGGFNALAEIERLGQLEFALMTPDEREKVRRTRFEIVSRPNTDEIVPADQVRPEE